ncbi:MAG: NACHT domain-containing protein [Nostoc sp. EkiNYC01]|nr:hypothetical protein [Nostoc sp. EkiNYC01]
MYTELIWNQEPFRNEEEVKSCIQLLSDTYPAFNLVNNKEGTTRNSVWVCILYSPDKTYTDIASKLNFSEENISNYGNELKYNLTKILNSWFLLVDNRNIVTVDLNRNNLNFIQGNKTNKVVENKQGYGVIAAVRRLQMISFIFPFYNSKEWTNYIEETNGKLSLIGFQQDNYPQTEEFYIEPDFLNSEGEEVKASIGQPKARILITGASGMGKTSYLKHLAMLCYRQEICQDYIPVYISLRRAAFLEHQLPQDSSQKPIDIYMSVLNNNWGVKLTHEQLINVLVNGKALVLIDGLDVNHINSFYHFNQIKEFISMYPKNSFVISSKGLDFLTNSLCDERLEVFELKNFDLKRAEEFIGNYLKKAREQDSSKDDINNILNRYSVEYTKGYNPLLLSCLCCYRHDESISEPEKNSKNSTELMQKSIHKFVSDWDEVRSPDNSDPYFLLLSEQRIKLLGFLAIRFMQGINHNGNRANEPAKKDNVLNWIIEFIDQLDIKNTLEERYLKLGSNYSIESISSQKKIATYILNSIEFQDGLIFEQYNGKGEIWFLHGAIQKYLAAEYLSYQGLTELDKFLSLQGDWVEVVQQALRLIIDRNGSTNKMKIGDIEITISTNLPNT